MIDPFEAMNAVGLLAFAIVGALKAADADLDLLGVTVLGVTTALGGGVTRDLLVDTVPLALRSTTDVSIALLGVVLAVAFVRRGTPFVERAVRIPDAVGLSAFATTGALVAADAGLSPFGVVVLAAVTGVGGGVVSDLLLRNVPFVLVEDFYATCAVVGGAVFWATTAAGLGSDAAAGICAATVLALRLLAIRNDWSLPTV